MIDRAELLPHYEIVQEGVLFLGRQRLRLPAGQISLLHEIAANPAGIGRFSDDKLGDFRKLERQGIVTSYERHSGERHSGTSAATILVISPHRDDAGFSVGGTLFVKRREFSIRIVNVFTRDFYSIYRWLGQDRPRLTKIRLAEESLLGRSLGCEIVDCDLTDVAERKEDPATTADRLAARFREFLTEDVSWCLVPSGIGRHPDHVLCRQAAERVAGDFPEIRFSLYEDQPYATRNGIRTCCDQGFSIDVTSAVDRKRKLMSIYQTQITRSETENVIGYMKSPGDHPPRYLESFTDLPTTVTCDHALKESR